MPFFKMYQLLQMLIQAGKKSPPFVLIHVIFYFHPDFGFLFQEKPPSK